MLIFLFLFLSLKASEIELSTITTGSSSSTPSRDIMDALALRFFKNDDKLLERLRPLLESKIELALTKKKIPPSITLLIDEENLTLDPNLERFMATTITKAMKIAFDSEIQSKLQYQEQAADRISKPKVALITSIATVITALITAGVTVAVAFGTK